MSDETATPREQVLDLLLFAVEKVMEEAAFTVTRFSEEADRRRAGGRLRAAVLACRQVRTGGLEENRDRAPWGRSPATVKLKYHVLDRGFAAYVDGDPPGGPSGFGATRAEALGAYEEREREWRRSKPLMEG